MVQQLKLMAHDGEERVAQAYKDEVARLGYTDTHMLNMTQQRNILDAARHCRLAHVRQSRLPRRRCLRSLQTTRRLQT